MDISLPDDLVQRANLLAADGEDIATILGRGVDRLEADAIEVAAVQQGIEDHQ